MKKRLRTTQKWTMGLLLAGGGAVLPAAAPESGPFRDYGYLTVGDGVRLAYVVYLPAREGRFPVLVQYSPYLGGGLDPIKHQSNAAGAEMFLREGYAILSVSGRGTGCSEGVHELLSEWEARDGAALIEWAGAQPWSDGNVGMVGNSYSGTSLYLTAGRRPKYLKALAVGGSPVDAYRDAAYPGFWTGAFASGVSFLSYGANAR